MKIDLSGKLAIVTGSTAGIGYGIAKGLAASGARVVINGRTRARVDAAIAALRKDCPEGQAVGVAADAGTAAGCDAIIKATPACDILVTNVGIFSPRPFADIPDADWMRMFEVNVMSGVRLSRAYGPGMKAKGWGRIVFISSESGVQIPVEMIDYGMTKIAQLAVSRGLAEDMAGTGVTVNAVLPGPTTSEGAEGFLSELGRRSGRSAQEAAADFIKTARPSSLLQRFASVDEVANMVVYVCSREASATTGAALRVDGGVVRSIV